MAVDNIARGMAAKALENQGGDGSSLPIVNTATVGQIIKVAAVDGDGKPTEWEAGNVSWNDLEDKPFGFKDEVVVLPETEVAFDEENGVYVINTPISFEIGKVYRVTYNGAGYFCEAKGWYDPFERIDTTYLGNSLPATYIDTHEPFLIAPMGGVLLIGDMSGSEPSPTITISITKVLVEKLNPLVIPKPVEQSFFLDSIIDPIIYENIDEFNQNNEYPTKLRPELLKVNVENFRAIIQYLSDNNVQCAFCSYGSVPEFSPTKPDNIRASILTPSVNYDAGNPIPYIKLRYINLSIDVENDELVAYAGLCIVV